MGLINNRLSVPDLSSAYSNNALLQLLPQLMNLYRNAGISARLSPSEQALLAAMNLGTNLNTDLFALLNLDMVNNMNNVKPLVNYTSAAPELNTADIKIDPKYVPEQMVAKATSMQKLGYKINDGIKGLKDKFNIYSHAKNSLTSGEYAKFKTQSLGERMDDFKANMTPDKIKAAGRMTAAGLNAGLQVADLLITKPDFLGTKTADAITSIGSALPVVGPAFLAFGSAIRIADSLGAKEVEGSNMSLEELANMGGSFGGMLDAHSQMQKNKGSYGFFARGKRKRAEEYRRRAMAMADKTNNIVDDALDMKSMGDTNLSFLLNLALLQGLDTNQLRFAKRGAKLILMRKKGGKVNVIPEGALHARKHNLDIELITNKGIPVVLEDGGELILQAEIEVNEIIFHKELTDKLEELAKKGTDEAAIEAGKLLAKEILHNTKDKTGLIKDIKNAES